MKLTHWLRDSNSSKTNFALLCSAKLDIVNAASPGGLPLAFDVLYFASQRILCIAKFDGVE
jgi:hypothetical protein